MSSVDIAWPCLLSMHGVMQAIVNNNWAEVVDDKQGEEGGKLVTLTRMELCLAGSGQARPGDLHELRPAAADRTDPAAKNGRTVRLFWLQNLNSSD